MNIAVDFDGTIVEDKYPEIGCEKPFATVTLRQLIKDGHKLILWSVREGDALEEAVKWCEERGVRFYAINSDIDENDNELKGKDHYSRKVKAHVFIDDRNIGGLPDWSTIYQIISKRVTYEDIMLKQQNLHDAKPKKKSWWKL